MTYTESLEKMFNEGFTMLWDTVKATPEDKLTWKPEPTSRSMRELLEELYTSTAGQVHMLKTKEGFGEEDLHEKELSLADLEEKFRAAANDYLAAAKAFPEAELDEVKDFPWGKMTFFDLLTYPYWNLMYHYGQIAYIQTLYGDTDMH